VVIVALVVVGLIIRVTTGWASRRAYKRGVADGIERAKEDETEGKKAQE
jgi:hypothetical protein